MPPPIPESESAATPRWVGALTLSNPGAGVWAFAALSRVFGLETPPALSMGVAAMEPGASGGVPWWNVLVPRFWALG